MQQPEQRATVVARPKRCPDCGEVKPAAAFYAHRRNSDGRQTYCIPCAKVRAAAWQRANPRKRNMIRRQYYQRHREQEIARATAYYQRRREQQRQAPQRGA